MDINFQKKKQLRIRKKWCKNQIKISKELRDIIHGYIMSDGYVNPNGALTVDQGKKQANFVEWLYETFNELRTDTKIGSVRRVGVGRNPTTSKRFNTKRLLQGFRRMWYTQATNDEGKTIYKKRLPKSLDCFFNSTFLTLWFAGDGTKILGSSPKGKGAKFEVTNFTKEERHRLKALFKRKYQIHALINQSGVSKTGTIQWTININVDDYQKFRSLVTEMDLIENLFAYKLHPKA